MSGKSRGQVSIEYMVIIGFVTIITIPLIIIYHTFVKDSREEISSNQILQLAKKIVDASESVYYHGEPSQTAIRVNVPDGITAVDLSYGYELVFKIQTGGGSSDIVQRSLVNITGSLPIDEGIYTITVKAISNHVEVSYK